MSESIVVIGALPSSLINFRGDLINSFVEHGFKVNAMASDSYPIDLAVFSLSGINYYPYPISRSGLKPTEDLSTFISLLKFFKKLKPNYILAYTIKPVIWGGLAASFTPNVKFYAMITGLGFAFQKGGFFKSMLITLVKLLYKFSLRKAKAVIFQNYDNLNVFVEHKLVNPKNCFVVNGSGVNLNHFEKKIISSKNVFLLIARLLKDKGIYEYIKAAEIVKSKYPDAEFHLVGPEDPSPDGISVQELSLINSSVIYHGESSDVRPWLEMCSVFVLPSYHEGMPRTVLEAMAIGRPILTTNVPGCKDTVIEGVNGWLVSKCSVTELATRMIWFIENPDKLQEMGDESYNIACKNFDVRIVNRRIFEIMELSNEKTF